MRRFATGVTMVTAAEGPAPGGVTVNAFTALSLSPPQVLVCLDNGSRTLGQILAAESFAVNVLGAGQQELARRFADKSLTAAERFAHVPTWPLTTGAPAIQGSIAVLDCRLVHAWRSGDHTVLVGEVVDGSAEGEDDPLIFYAGGYRQLVARRDIACATSLPTAPHNRFTAHTEDAAAPRCFAKRTTWIARRPQHQGRNGHGRANTDERQPNDGHRLPPDVVDRRGARRDGLTANRPTRRASRGARTSFSSRCGRGGAGGISRLPSVQSALAPAAARGDDRASDTLAQYQVTYEADGDHLREVAEPRLYPTSHASPQPFLSPLDEVEWHQAQGRVPYRPRRRRGVAAQQERLFDREGEASVG